MSKPYSCWGCDFHDPIGDYCYRDSKDLHFNRACDEKDTDIESAFKDIAEGRFKTFTDTDALFKDLDEPEKKPCDMKDTNPACLEFCPLDPDPEKMKK